VLQNSIRAYSRLLQAGITKDQWPAYFKEVLRVLKPGSGWIQLTEPKTQPLLAVKGELPQDSAFREVSLTPRNKTDFISLESFGMNGESVPT